MSGRATFTGTTFQAQVGARIAGLLLTERPLSRLATGLLGTPLKIQFETPTQVDDILVYTSIGEVYVQAKNTISLSREPTGNLASVATQFVRQFRAGAGGEDNPRPLTPDRDRLVLAVSPATAASITQHLRTVLDRHRTNAATALPKKLQDALDIFTELIDAAWSQATGQAITPVERQQLLALCSVIVIGDPERRQVEEMLLDIVERGAETPLTELLENWASNASGEGVGGDAATIRWWLSDKSQLREPPSFRDDVQKLRDYSATTLAELARFTTIEVPEGTIRLTRTMTAHVREAASQGSLLITGEPGAGKSAVLHALAQELLGQQHLVVCFTVESGLGSLAALKDEIDLQHPLLEVLPQVPGLRPAYLLLDALDASRGGPAEALYKKLLKAVAAWPDWHVVASVRSFDLRVDLGLGWQQLFRGVAPSAGYANSNFPTVRHLHLPLLDESEQADLALQSPSLGSALAAGGAKLQALARNPFNLALLADLLTGGASPTALAGVATRGQLLAEYWRVRVVSLGSPATASLAYVVRKLLKNKTLVLPEAHLKPAAAPAVGDLERVGVLSLDVSRQVLSFRHHVLFDYAVARLALLPDRDKARQQLLKERTAGLLIAPSLAYWVEGLHSSMTARAFWPFVGAFIADPAIDPLIRVEVTRLAIETVLPTDDLAELGEFLRRDTAVAAQSFRQWVGALQTKVAAKQLLEVAPWARLLASINAPRLAQLGSMQMLTGLLLDHNPDTESLAHLGATSRRLFPLLADNENVMYLFARYLIAYVAQTYVTAPAASYHLLHQVLEPARFAQFGYLELPALARHVRPIAAHGAELIVQLYHRAFLANDFSQEQKTTMLPSTIMAFHSNAAQDLKMAQHELAQEFPWLLREFPATGLRTLAATLRGVWTTHEPAPDFASPPPTLMIHGVAYPFVEDNSADWTWDLDHNYGEAYAQMYRAFNEWLRTTSDPELLAQVPHLLLAESGMTLVWRLLFEAGASQPDSLGADLLAAAASGHALCSTSTYSSAIALLATRFHLLTPTERAALEQQWLQLDFAGGIDPPAMRLLVLGQLFEAIGAAQLVTAEAQQLLQAAVATSYSLPDSPPFEASPTNESQPSAGNTRPALEEVHFGNLVRACTQAQAALRAHGTAEAAVGLQDALLALDAASRQDDGEPIDGLVTTLVRGWHQLLISQPGAAEAYPVAVTQLLKLTHHSSPPATEKAEAQFASFAIFSGAPARVEAAKALAALTEWPDLWPLIAERFEALLLHDPRPEVRCQLLDGLYALHQPHEEAVWQLVEKVAVQEHNPAVIQHGSGVFRMLAHVDAARLEPLVLQLVATAETQGRSIQGLTPLMLDFAFIHRLEASQTLLRHWVRTYATAEKQVRAVLSVLGEYLVQGYGPTEPELAPAGQQARALAWLLVEATEPAVGSWPSDGQDPTAEQVTALQLFSELAGRLVAAAGRRELAYQLRSEAAQRQFLDDYAPLITRLNAFGPPAAIYQIMDLLGQLVDANPELCFDLFSSAMLRTTGVASYEKERQGADQFVKLVNRYLANYRHLFAEDPRRSQLVECLAVFVDTGWPEARRLFQDLPELLQ